ncbi:MAG: hypothetical protein Q4G27_05935 [Flavobacteriaceae bacterium]|nr:hypothetical protein [Flavobacteriaceae bacterium]
MRLIILLFFGFSILSLGQEQNPYLCISYLKNRDLLNINLIYPENIRILSYLLYDENEVSVRDDYYFLVTFWDENGNKLQSSTMVSTFTPTEDNLIINDNTIPYCDYNILPNLHYNIYFKIANEQNRFYLIEEIPNIEKFENSKYLDYFNFQKGNLYRVKVMLYLGDELLISSNSFDFVY